MDRFWLTILDVSMSCSTSGSEFLGLSKLRKSGLDSPGDSLYNPAWSWHNIKKNTADEETKLVVMSACRWTDVHQTFWLAPALELYKSLGMEAFLHPSVPLWLRWIPFFRVGQDSFRQATWIGISQ